MVTEGRRIYGFGKFSVNPTERLLLLDGQPIPITGKAFEVLVVLLQKNGHLVTKSELMKAVWSDAFVEDGNLAVTISMLRKALGDGGPEHRYIQTVPKQGYRFQGEVLEVVEPPGSKAEETAKPDFEAILPSPPIDVVSEITQDIPTQQSAVNPALLPRASVPDTVRNRTYSWTLALSLSLVALTSLAGLTSLAYRRSTRMNVRANSLVVMPFKNLNSDGKQEYLGVGMADAIITKLASTGQVIVRPTTSVSQYANSAVDPVEIGKQEKVDVVLVGDIETSAELIRIDVQLVRVSDASVLWAEQFEEKPEEMVALEQEVEDKIIQSLSVHASIQEKTDSVGRQTHSSAAYTAYTEGRYFWNKRTEDGLWRSIEYFQKAAQDDPEYAVAFAGLADSYTLLDSYGVEPYGQACPKAKVAADKALELDDKLPEAHASQGMIALYCEWDWLKSEQEFSRSIALDPNYTLAHTWYALHLAATGRFDDSLAQIRKAQELDPVSLVTATEVGRIFYWSRQYDHAIEAFQMATDLDPAFARAHTSLGMAYVAKGDFANAIREFKETQRLSPHDPYLEALLGYSQGLAGDTYGARSTLRKLTDGAHYQYVPAYSMVLAYIGLGQRENALKWLDKSYDDHSTYLLYVKVDPLLDPIRSNPRFSDVLGRMSLLPPRENRKVEALLGHF